MVPRNLGRGAAAYGTVPQSTQPVCAEVLYAVSGGWQIPSPQTLIEAGARNVQTAS